MNFYEVKVGKTSRRGHFESFNSFVAKTEMSHSQLHEKLRNSYKGFEISLSNIEAIEEFKKEIVVENNQVQPNKGKIVSELLLNSDCRKLPMELQTLRDEFIKNKQLADESESKFLSELLSYLNNKHGNLSYKVKNIKSTYSNYSDFDYVLIFNGNLKTLLENN